MACKVEEQTDAFRVTFKGRPMFYLPKERSKNFYEQLKQGGLSAEQITELEEKIYGIDGLYNKATQNTNQKKPEIFLPYKGKLVSEFAIEVAEIMKETNTLFYRVDQREIVEVGKIKDKKTGKEIYTGFITINPNRFITLIEEYITPGSMTAGTATQDPYFVKASIKREIANTALCSKIMQEALPQIERIFTIPIPIMFEGKITFPCGGYDERFNSWLPYDAPEITKPDMNLKEAKEIIKKIFEEFCFPEKQDYYNAIAALLTPFLRGLLPQFCTRTPIFFYLGNRERTGKDYCAGITGIVYEGSALEEPPVSSEENRKTNNSEELRKKFLAALMTGRKRLHFSNNKGYINNVAFEAIATAEKFSDRLLGKNELISLDNEIDFSLSGNTGVSFTPDFASRCRFINLFLDIEDANQRKFKNPNLHEWVKENREEIISALYTLVKDWVDEGQKKGSLPFASYNSWAEICGGIMENAGYGNPCTVDKENLFLVGGDTETNDMKELFKTLYEKFPDTWIDKKTILDYVAEESELFGYLSPSEITGRTKLGRLVSKFINRILADIRLRVADKKIRADRQKLMFSMKPREEVSKDVFDEGFEKKGDDN